MKYHGGIFAAKGKGQSGKTTFLAQPMRRIPAIISEQCFACKKAFSP
ncbi:hypothetical protein yaldo0001_15980 [Yersinia aldovae ATCC 35236]|nr:hypothetical protein yaldo0001_15980 [Yersinia aldovae ATCC 35236]